MDYLTAKQAAEKWGITANRVTILCKGGKIPDVVRVGGQWMIPRNTSKPADGRTKAARAEIKEDYFRFPLYVNSSVESFTPALSDEEKALRQAELDFLACDFRNAEKGLKKLSENAENNYVRIMSLFFLCWLSAVNYCGIGYNYYFMDLEQTLAKDFPHKREMELLRPWLYIVFTQYERAAEYLDFDINYGYSPTVLPLMSYLFYVDKCGFEQTEAIAARINLYEIEARHFTNVGNIFEAQALHLALFVFYFTAANEERMISHLKSAVEIAFQYNFIYSVADAYPYYKSVFNSVLCDYPQDFTDKIKQCGLKIDKSFSLFTKKNHIGEIFYLLSNSDIKFVLYASQGYSYRQVAGIIHVSERTVANRYAEIYDKLGVDGKQGLLEMIKDSTAKKQVKR